MKYEDIIYYNELSKFAEAFTQKNIDENEEIYLGGSLSCHPSEILDLLLQNYECFVKTNNPDVSLYFELKHVANYLVLDLGVQLKEWAEVDRGITLRGATLIFKKEDVIINGVHGNALAQISNVNIKAGDMMYLSAVYQTVGNITLAIAKYLFYDENWEKYIRIRN